MTRSPIRTVLSTLSTSGVRFLLMGGQACIFYGAAEFSRDTDIAILADAQNLARLADALARLEAERIALPPFELEYLLRGHAVHFRCRRGDESALELQMEEEARAERARDRDYWRPRMLELEQMRYAEARRKHDGPPPAG